MIHSEIPPPARTLAIALGGNLPSQIGEPCNTLKAARPIVETIVQNWLKFYLTKLKNTNFTNENLRFRWSPLFKTNPIGGPTNQPAYINAVLIIDGPKLSLLKPSEEYALALLRKFLNLEKKFGRKRDQEKICWGPRTLDIDLLAWGTLQLQTKELTLPHPRLVERSFVITPLAAALNQEEIAPKQITSKKDWSY